jgi:hypothetical protein
VTTPHPAASRGSKERAEDASAKLSECLSFPDLKETPRIRLMWGIHVLIVITPRFLAEWVKSRDESGKLENSVLIKRTCFTKENLWFIK